MTDALEIFSSLFAPPAREFCIPPQTGAADAFAALSLAMPRRIVLAVAPGIPAADRLADDLRVVAAASPSAAAAGARILEFPPPLDGDRTALGLRLKTLAAVRSFAMRPYPCVVVAPFSALEAPLPPASEAAGFSVSAAGPGFKALCEKISAAGYERAAQVEREGDWSVRGGIVDFWCPGEPLPVRAEFFGEELESMRTFDPATQRSVEKIETAEILPVSRQAEDGADGELLAASLPDGSAVVAISHDEYKLDAAVPDRGRFTVCHVGDPPPPGVATWGFETTPLPGFAELGADEAHHPELFDAARKRLEQHLAAARRRGATVAALDDLSGGFGLGDALAVVSKADRVFAKRKVRGRAAPQQGRRLSDFDDLEPGEYVVHVDHGVGRYTGSAEIMIDGRRSEVFTIEYAEGGMLHVPASHAHLLSRYVGVKGEEVRLHRLDGTRWEKDKKDAQKAVSDLAAALLETQAKRETVPGFAYDVACEGRDAFDAAFPYEETPDQAAAIAAVDRDLAARKPMDRLVCGDAGYGKTEVAMRAAFVVAMNGRQVAVLAPTTVLAEQHFETFSSRFDGTPIRVESVSRLQGAGAHDGTFRRLASGACDIVIGTHALLSKKTVFHDLGLIVIDEEQRFGVRHKEFLKRLRETADVLTLSATPIPRTLYLSMTGARDLSLLRTPPRARVAVETKIVRDSDAAVAAAVEREIARGGQVYFLHNRVKTIEKAEARLKALCPKAKIAVAHGQMDSATLARRMRSFERGECDVLLCTTIVESGLDIPRANTIVVERADTFGLADLYQLRGRVGRSSRQGYAYLMLPPSGDVDSDARERLAAIRRHGGLGAGFNLAVRDLELRGAGNLLGSQQSGHIAAVGFGLYCQLLKRTIARLKGEKVRDVVDVKLNLDFAAPRIPYEYVEDDSQRMALMKRFAEAQDLAAVREAAAEMRDRFGPPPPEAEMFAKISRLRVKCAAAGVSRIDARGGRAFLQRAGEDVPCAVVELRGRTPERMLAEISAAVGGAHPA